MSMASSTSASKSTDDKPSKSDKSEARKALRSREKRLKDAMKSFLYLAEKVPGLGKGQPLEQDVTHESGEIVHMKVTKSELRELGTQVYDELTSILEANKRLNRPKRKTAPFTGLSAPKYFDSRLADFFAVASLGEAYNGNLEEVSKGKRGKSGKTTKELVEGSVVSTGEPLNNYLFFAHAQLRDGTANPAYRIMSRAILTSLFSIHVYHANMAVYPDEPGRYRASDQMFEHLGTFMQQSINTDVQKFVQDFPGQAQEIRRLGTGLLDAVRNYRNVPLTQPPQNVVAVPEKGVVEPGQEVKMVEKEIFNPFYFTHAHFSKIIRDAIDKSQTIPPALDLENLDEGDPNRVALERSIYSAYYKPGTIFGNMLPHNSLHYLLDVQAHYAAVAKGVKNLQKKMTEPKRKGKKKTTAKAAAPPAVQTQPPALGTAAPGLGTLAPVTGSSAL